jgi:hypothetical protein
MIILQKDSRQARFFRWCLNNPFAIGNYQKDDGTYEDRKPDWYIENGTTLCHFFWACFWIPMIIVGLLSFVLMMVFQAHVEAYNKFGTIGLFIPSGMVIGVIFTVGTIFLVIMGADKVGLLKYLKAIKEKVCPRITFEDRETN